METGILTCGPTDRLGEEAARARAAGTELCVVLQPGGVIMGVLRRERLAGPADQTAEEAMRPGPSTFRPSVPIDEMIEFLARRNISGALVGTPDGRLLGAVTLAALQLAAAERRAAVSD